MDIFKPMLFVGLGGTGGLIAAELERHLRDELCGPDGTALIRRLGGQYDPYQLPRLTQFIYADLDTEDLTKRRRSLVPDQHAKVVTQTARFVSELSPPNVNGSSQLRKMLGIAAPEYTRNWLPPEHPNDPNISPLDKGAGQLPTVGRAALFEAIRTNPDPIVKPIRRALGEFAKAGGELAAFGGGNHTQSADVFVAFSVAGGTGAGLFYDYLHLIWKTFNDYSWKARIFPLVVMPSALIDVAPEKGRALKLNAGRSLLDLFRLVDDQNSHRAADGSGRHTSLGVDYPTLGRVEIAPSSVQTAILFNKPAGLGRGDLIRSIASLVESLVATPRPEGINVVEDMSFAAKFINETGSRQERGRAGIGRQGVSTSLVASLTVPVDSIADAISGHLLANAVRLLAQPPSSAGQNSQALVGQFFSSAGLAELWKRDATDIPLEDPVSGAAKIADELRDRQVAMGNLVDTHRRELKVKVPVLAAKYNYRDAVAALLGQGVDLFHALRVALGDAKQDHELGRLGFAGMLERRTRPDESRALPAMPTLNSSFGLRRIRWTNTAVTATVSDQNDWYVNQIRRLWSDAWAAESQVWRRSAARMRAELVPITEVFEDYANRTEPKNYLTACADLYRERTGALYVLPETGSEDNLDLFYDHVVRALRHSYTLPDTAHEGSIVTAMLGNAGWANAFHIGYSRGAADALGDVRGVLKEKVKQVFSENLSDGFALLPSLPTLLRDRAIGGAGLDSSPWRNQFCSKLSQLLPAGFVPQGDGGSAMDLISYPGSAKDPDVEHLLKELLGKPDAATLPNRSESLVVVQFRSALGVTDVREVREVLRFWALAQAEPQNTDHLRWRQRLGYRSDWLMTNDADRVEITHRMMCALWNGTVDVTAGSVKTPSRVAFRSGENFAITLPLRQFGAASSWGSLVRSYEDFALSLDDPTVFEACHRLMSTSPTGLSEHPVEPAELYRDFRRVALGQRKVIDEMLPSLPPDTQVKALQWRDFFTVTVEAALDLRFESSQAIRGSLRELEDYFAPGQNGQVADLGDPNGRALGTPLAV